MLLFPDTKTSFSFGLTQSPKEVFYIKPIQRATAMRIVTESHYLHRSCPCSFAFGLFCKDSGGLVGVIVYGTPSSAPLRSGVCGKDEAGNVIELTRLWVADGTPKNTESFFIGNTLPLIDKEIVVSFADPTAGHVGTVYQASNWIYTGLSAKRTDWNIEGVKRHGQTIGDKYTAAYLREHAGERFTLKDRPQKHRYVYFNAKPRRRKELLSKLKYPVTAYPKSANQ